MPAGGTGVCHHPRANKRVGKPVICGYVHGDDGGDHPLKCKVGGGDNVRHDAVMDELHGWITDRGIQAQREQDIPKWHTPQEKTRLDISYTGGRLGNVCVDVSVVAASSNLSPKQSIKALERREKIKHARYQGPGLFAFVLDARGRWGKEANAFMQSVVGSLPAAERAEAVKECRRRVSRTLQFATAEQLLSAAARPPAIVEASYLGRPG